MGLVLATMVAIAVVAFALVDGLPWAAAFTLGAIVSPTDLLAATTTARRLGVLRRLVMLLEGESLVNDATALVTGGLPNLCRRGQKSGQPPCGYSAVGSCSVT